MTTIAEYPGFTSGDPFLSGSYAPVFDERHDTDLPVIGDIPEGLRGVFMRNGPNQAFEPTGRYHIFDGDGMVHAIYVDDAGRVAYRNRWVQSKGLLAERERGRALFGGLSNFTFPEPEVMAEAGMLKNTANTNIVRHAGRYLALMEGCPPIELTRDLGTLGEVGFGGRLRGSFTAHPRWDPATGELHFFGYLPMAPFLRYGVLDGAGTLTHLTEIGIERAVMMHDFVITEHHAVFFDLPALFDLEGGMAGTAPFIRWDAGAGARVGVLPLHADGTDIRWYDIPPCYAFHFLNAWEDNGRIVVVGCRAAEMPTSFGDEPVPDVQPMLHRWEIDLGAGGSVTESQLDDRPGDFPRINFSRQGRHTRYGYVTHSSSWTPDGAVFDGVIAHDLVAGTSTTHVYGPHHHAGEPVFAADPAGTDENHGWILNFVTDTTADTTEFVVLDARDVAAGPVARVPMPRRVPLGFHGNWMPES